MFISDAGGPWILDQFYSLADTCVGPLSDCMEDLGYDYLWIDNIPKMTEWFENIKSRIAYEKACYHGSPYSEIFLELNLRGCAGLISKGRYLSSALLWQSP